MRELLTRYGVGVVTDPAPFLSTIIVTSAGLVAIIGGLLVARFVSLDSDQKGTRKVLDEAADRLAAAHRRAAQARSNLNAWDADGFLRGNVLDAIGEGITDLNLLRRLDDCQLTDDELSPFVADVAEEFARARAELAARPINDFLDVSGWDRFRQATHGLLEIRWPRVWRTVFEEMRGDRAEELAAARKQRAARACRCPPWPSSPRWRPPTLGCWHWQARPTTARSRRGAMTTSPRRISARSSRSRITRPSSGGCARRTMRSSGPMCAFGGPQPSWSCSRSSGWRCPCG